MQEVLKKEKTMLSPEDFDSEEEFLMYIDDLWFSERYVNFKALFIMFIVSMLILVGIVIGVVKLIDVVF